MYRLTSLLRASGMAGSRRPADAIQALFLLLISALASSSAGLFPQWEGWQLAALTHTLLVLQPQQQEEYLLAVRIQQSQKENVTEPVWAGQQETESSPHFQNGLVGGPSHLRKRWLCTKNDMNTWGLEAKGHSYNAQRLVSVVQKGGSFFPTTDQAFSKEARRGGMITCVQQHQLSKPQRQEICLPSSIFKLLNIYSPEDGKCII